MPFNAIFAHKLSSERGVLHATLIQIFSAQTVGEIPCINGGVARNFLFMEAMEYQLVCRIETSAKQKMSSFKVSTLL